MKQVFGSDIGGSGIKGAPVNLKKGQFLSPWDMAHVVDKATSTGNTKVLVTERGTSFGYNNLVVDVRGLIVMAESGFPVVLDVSHSLRRRSPALAWRREWTRCSWRSTTTRTVP